MSDHKNIQAAKLAVMDAVQYVQKTGEASSGGGGRYKFMSEAELLRKVRPELVEHGIGVAPVAVQVLEEGATKNGTTIARLLITYEFHHTSGTFEQVQVVGAAMDAGDKHYNKAMTIGLKYAIRQWLILETGDDPDIVREHINDEPMAETMRYAHKTLMATKTPDDVRQWQDRVHHATTKGTDDPLFTPDQLSELDRMADMHLRGIGE